MASVDQIQRSASETDKASSANDITSNSSSASASTPPEKSTALNDLIYPADSYTQGDHVYWGDLPLGRRLAWTGKQSNEEAARELAHVGRMFKRDPLSPISAYFSNYVVTGMGLFVEGYVLFSVGNLTPLFKAVWPECWKNHQVCSPGWTAAVDYLEIVGIIVGQILVGIQGDWVGRKFGMVQDALIMTLGSIMLTAMWGTTLQGWVICYALSLFIYGIGVGGEYPMTSTRAMEAAANGGAGDRLHRGRRVALAFLMQGWGQLANQVVLILALLVTHNTLDAPFNKVSTQWTFRIQFAVIILPTLYLAYLRYYKLRYNDTLSQAKKRLNTSGYDIKSLKLASSHYWHRMVGTAFVWFANDVAFYGAKIFSGVFIATINGGTATLGETWLWNLVNIGVSLIGYYMGALFIDHKMYGRKWMQANGLIAIFICYIISGAVYPQLTQPGMGVHWFQAIYFLSSFFTQFGPNTTSFLLAAEVYPASIRATAHGVSAATGKLGALLAAVAFNYISNRDKFYLTAPFAVAAWILTLICVPDVTGLDLREQERYWAKVMEGKASEYHGVAVCPRHLSLWERVVLKRHRAYDPEEDAKDKKRELQALYESADGEEVDKAPLSDEEKAFLRNDLGGFFATEAKLNKPLQGGGEAHESKLADLEKRLS
ncbi:MFS general substrate transporter [Jaminaea rosea]|uniref:MFS general substrate transporter n=1 Tax=Jaminaea rosea TaxID=1569628 RepID=A0A316UJ12_9BASI|nr:MFS general substrate transporter [Jaminaea rosea]PWN25210.1 MFS general substrate transporter [Jaminaea rosea]